MINLAKCVREAVAKTPGLDDALKDSIEPMRSLLYSLFFRLNLKDKPFASYHPASKHQIEGFFDILTDVDPLVTRLDRSKDCLKNRPGLKEFFEHCCFERKYVFGIKKCGKTDCHICKPPRLPVDIFKELHHLPDPTPDDPLHYKSFGDLYGTLTTEKHRPSVKNKSGRLAHGIPFTPNAQTARDLVLCSECLKPRVVYSQRKLSIVEEIVFSRSVEGILYSCGSVLQGVEVELRPGENVSVMTLFDRLFVRENLLCSDAIEVPFYSSERFGKVCSSCGCSEKSSREGEYPLCEGCRNNGCSPLVKRKRVQRKS